MEKRRCQRKFSTGDTTNNLRHQSSGSSRQIVRRLNNGGGGDESPQQIEHIFEADPDFQASLAHVLQGGPEITQHDFCVLLNTPL